MADLALLVQSQVQVAFKLIGTLAKKGTWVQRTAGKPNFKAGTLGGQENSYPLPRCVISRYKIEDVDHQIVTLKDSKLLFPRQDLGVEPQETDIFIDYTGKRWTVMRIQSDPAAAVVVAQIRTAANTITSGSVGGS